MQINEETIKRIEAQVSAPNLKAQLEDMIERNLLSSFSDGVWVGIGSTARLVLGLLDDEKPNTVEDDNDEYDIEHTVAFDPELKKLEGDFCKLLEYQNQIFINTFKLLAEEMIRGGALKNTVEKMALISKKTKDRLVELYKEQ